MRYLSDILEGLAFTELHGSADMEISAIVFDSRKVVPGSLFVAVKGTVVDGHDYIDQAVKQGAVAVICEDLPAHTAAEADFFMVANSAAALGIVASNFYDRPSEKMKLVGVTEGTKPYKVKYLGEDAEEVVPARVPFGSDFFDGHGKCH